jgi:5'-nucleotidase
MAEEEIEHIALFDMDGTLCEYEYQLRSDLRRIAAPSEKIIQNIYEEEEFDFDYMRERIDLIRSQSGWWRKLCPIDMNINLIHIAKEIGFDIRILTKGPRTCPNAWTEKFEWCQKYIVPVVPNLQVTVTQDKGMIYGKLLVDDYPDYMDRWLKWRPRGLGIMPAREYNIGYKHPNVIRFDGTNVDQVKRAMNFCYGRKTEWIAPRQIVDYSSM